MVIASICCSSFAGCFVVVIVVVIDVVVVVVIVVVVVVSVSVVIVFCETSRCASPISCVSGCQ